MIDLLVFLAIVLAVLFGLPMLLYLCVKLATVGFYRGRRMSEKWESRENDDDERT